MKQSIQRMCFAYVYDQGSSFSERRSNISGSRPWYQMKGLAIRNTHVKYESCTTYQSKVMTKVKVFEKKVKLLRSKIRGSKSWYQIKGLTRRNTHVIYKIPTTNQPKVMTKVNVFEK
jgi:hypothetical protein